MRYVGKMDNPGSPDHGEWFIWEDGLEPLGRDGDHYTGFETEAAALAALTHLGAA